MLINTFGVLTAKAKFSWGSSDLTHVKSSMGKHVTQMFTSLSSFRSCEDSFAIQRVEYTENDPDVKLSSMYWCLIFVFGCVHHGSTGNVL